MRVYGTNEKTALSTWYKYCDCAVAHHSQHCGGGLHRLVAEAVVRRPNVSHNQIVSDTEALAMLLRFAARATVPAAAPAPSPASLVSAI